MRRLFLSILAAAGIIFGTFAAETPSYPGGEEAMKKFIASTMIYPQPAIDNGVEGIVTLRVTVRPDGSIGSIKVVKMIDPDLEQEAIRIVKKMPAWIPADDNGTPIESTADILVVFELSE